jgi:ribosomal protein S27AE
MTRVISAKKMILGSRECPRCSGGFLMWDESEREPYCFNCGWRNSIQITAEQAKARVKWSSWVDFLNEIGGLPSLNSVNWRS